MAQRILGPQDPALGLFQSDSAAAGQGKEGFLPDRHARLSLNSLEARNCPARSVRRHGTCDDQPAGRTKGRTVTVEDLMAGGKTNLRRSWSTSLHDWRRAIGGTGPARRRCLVARRTRS